MKGLLQCECWWKAGFSMCGLTAFPYLSFPGGMYQWGSQSSAEAGDSSHKNSMAFSGILHGWQQCCSLWLCISASCATSPTRPELMWDVCTSFGPMSTSAPASRALPAFQDVSCQNALLIPGGSMQSELIEPGQTQLTSNTGDSSQKKTELELENLDGLQMSHCMVFPTRAASKAGQQPFSPRITQNRLHCLVPLQELIEGNNPKQAWGLLLLIMGTSCALIE